MRRAKRDANHAAIADEMRRRSVEVIDMSAVGDIPDLLCGYRSFIGFIEVKIPGSRAAYTLRQLRWISNTKMPVAIVTNADDAMEFLTTGNGLTQKQKDALAAFCVTATKTQYHPAVIERVLGI